MSLRDHLRRNTRQICVEKNQKEIERDEEKEREREREGGEGKKEESQQRKKAYRLTLKRQTQQPI